MKQHTLNKSAFTLIELLMVIAIIGILAGILIPTVGAVKKQANIAASKSQLSNYVTAIGMFKGDYGYYPDFGASPSATDDSFEVNLGTKSTVFIKTLSGRGTDNAKLSATELATLGNRHGNAYHSFSESEYLYNDATGQIDATQLADRFGNTNIVMVIDANGDGIVNPSADDSSLKAALPSNGALRASVTAYAEPTDSTEDFPAYGLWN